MVECGNCGGFEFMRGSIRGKAPRSVFAHRSRGGYWGAIWTRCGIQSGLITIFTSSTWYLTTHESQIFQVFKIPAFTALKESCKQASFHIILLQFLQVTQLIEGSCIFSLFKAQVLDWLKGPAKYCRGVFCGVH